MQLLLIAITLLLSYFNSHDLTPIGLLSHSTSLIFLNYDGGHQESKFAIVYFT